MSEEQKSEAKDRKNAKATDGNKKGGMDSWKEKQANKKKEKEEGEAKGEN
jgi:hypothetical protein